MPKSLRIKLFLHLDYCCAALTNITRMEQDIKLGRAINACLRFVYEMEWDGMIISHLIINAYAGWRSMSEGNTLCCFLYSILKIRPQSLLSNFIPYWDIEQMNRNTRRSAGSSAVLNFIKDLFVLLRPIYGTASRMMYALRAPLVFKQKLYAHLSLEIIATSIHINFLIE